MMELLTRAQNNPRHAAFEGGGIAEEKNGLGDHLFGGNGREKMCLDELLPSGVPWVPWFVPAGASWLGRFVTAAVLLGKNKSRHIFPFHLPFFFVRKTGMSSCWISQAGNQLLRGSRWEICVS